MTKTKYVVSYTDSKGMRRTKVTDTYTGARKVADYIKKKVVKQEFRSSSTGV